MKNKVVVITGASSGIGKACAAAFAREGAKVVIAARSAEQLKLIEKELKERGGEVLAIRADVTNEMDCKRLIDQTVEKYGKLDILINNAGISMRAIFEDLDLEVIRKLMDVNFWGTVYCTKYAMPHLLDSKGWVIGVSSVAGYKGLPGRTGYSASKFAMNGFLEALRSENRNKGLNVLVLCPGYTTSNIRNTALAADGEQQGESPMNEGKMMSAEDVADRLISSILGKKRFVVLTMQGKLSFYLNKFFPALVDKMIFNVISNEPGSPVK